MYVLFRFCSGMVIVVARSTDQQKRQHGHAKHGRKENGTQLFVTSLFQPEIKKGFKDIRAQPGEYRLTLMWFHLRWFIPGLNKARHLVAMCHQVFFSGRSASLR